MSNLTLILWVMPLILIHTVDSSVTYYITLSPTTQCPMESCLTLSTLATDRSDIFDPNTAIVFLEGSHTLDSELFVSNINGSLILSSNGKGAAAIMCSGNASLKFFNIFQLHISGLEFISCSSEVEHIDQFTLKDSLFYGENVDSALHLNHTNASILRSSFELNTAGTYQSHVRILAHLLRDFHNIQSTSARVGGALVVTSSIVNISSSHFVGNTAKVGGAIFSQLGSNINIGNCTFVNNSAMGCRTYPFFRDDGCLGGALFIDSGCTVTAHNSTFMNNTAGYSGGAVALFQGTFLGNDHNMLSSNKAGGLGGAISAYSRSRITIDNSYYSNNTADDGGAIYAHSYSSINTGNSFFDKNEADDDGGVIFAQYSSNISVGGCSFNYNKAGDGGGVLFALNSSITVNNSFFDRNRADDSGGVMLAWNSSSITVSNSSFDRNEASDDGGVLYVSFDSSITASYSLFDGNKAGDNGGVMFAWKSSSITISNSFFDKNEAGDDGGVMFVWNISSITVSNGFFDRNVAGDDGGVMLARNSSSITVSNSSFDRSEANDNGGVMYVSFNSSISVDNSSFNNNMANDNGGVMQVHSSSHITMSNSFFGNNLANYSGGSLYVSSNSSVTVSNSFFNRNRADDNGGVMFVWNKSRITVSNIFCDRNEASNSGGVLYVSFNSSISVSCSSFNNNMASDNGGVMRILLSSHITVSNTSFGNNLVNDSGGVLYVSSNSSITVGNSSFNSNIAGNSGGVMQISSSNSITVGNSSFDNNEAGNTGGVIVANSRSSITVGNSSFVNSKAGYSGGVLFANSRSSITVGNSSFVNNEADNSGGVMLALDNSNITVEYSFFSNSVADHYDGGVIYAILYCHVFVGSSFFSTSEAGGDGGVMFASSSSSITVSNSSFDNNVAGNDGGVLAVSDSTVTVKNSIFNNNIVGNDGGVIRAQFSSSVTIDNTFFSDNEAKYGGGVSSRSSSVIVKSSHFKNNIAGDSGGAVSAWQSFSITIVESSFNNNTAVREGGIVYTHSSTDNFEISSIFTNNCTFIGNSASEGGVVYLRSVDFIDFGSMYCSNKASNGGVITLNDGNVKVTESKFVNNTARNDGGVLYSPSYDYAQVIKMEACFFFNNSANSGGTIAVLYNASVTVTASTFIHNNAIRGGAIYILIGSYFDASCSIFSHNSAKSDGGMICSENRNILRFKSCKLNFNRAENNGGAIYLLFQSELNITGNNTYFIGNQARSGGMAYVRESTTNIYSQNLLIANNSATETGGAIYSSGTILTFFSGNDILVQNQAHNGGALYASRSRVEAYNVSLLMANNTADTGGAVQVNKGQLVLSGSDNTFINNEAVDGGAIYVREGKLSLETDSQIEIYASSALRHGGAIYLTKSELKVKGESSYISRNRANSNGGGIYATNSSIIVEEVLYFVSNEAENGGGISLEKGAKLCGTLAGKSDMHAVNFIANRASHYGGALYIDDETNPDMCAVVSELSTIPSTECFSKSVFVNVSNNSAGVSGSNLFGGLLDRCTHEVRREYQKNNIILSGIRSFLNSSNIDESQLDTITSFPVRLCFCNNGQPDCNYQPESIRVSRGKTFSIDFIAYDQVLHPVNASVQCFLNSSAGGLGERQQIQNILYNTICSELKYDLFTPNNNEELTFSIVNGPCNNISGISKRKIMIEITCSCPIGFQISNNNETSCDCACDQVFQPYKKTDCNPITESIIRRENFWISYIHRSNSSGYVIYPHCPFDYCFTADKSVSINLNLPNGSDAQCDKNRMGTLCGTCKPGLSVSLGSSKCVPCPTYWPGLLVTIIVVFIISGIGLVAILLALNLTVAIGTLNAIIFYANIVVANKSALFPSGVSPASVFISWLNFDLGFDVCFFDGLDTYVKTWLQLAFPAYIIILVIVIIQLSYYFNAFGCLVGKKDPVATLATLILLSYTKLLQTIITVFSSATLAYPDGSKKTLWLPDATIEYFISKHVALFFVAILILLAGVVYTFLLFSWQWFLWCPRNHTKWIRNQKLNSFIEIFLIPYTRNHRYWTGLLLLIRVSLYLVSAFNPSGDPRVTLTATTFIMTSLVIYIATFSVRMYKNHFINIMEMLTYFNIIALSIFTWYTIDADTNQTAITNVSVGITFIQLTIVIVYHVYKHMNKKLFATIQGSVFCMNIKQMTSKMQKRHKNTDCHQYHEILDFIDCPPANTNDYNVFPMQPKSAEPSISVIELSKPQLAPATSPLPEAIEEEPKLESNDQQQESEQKDIDMIPVTENLATETKKNKHCINSYSGIQRVECNKIDKYCETKMEHSCTTQKEISIFQPDSNSQINDCPQKDIKQANKGASTQEVPGVSGLENGVGSQCIIVIAEVHDY